MFYLKRTQALLLFAGFLLVAIAFGAVLYLSQTSQDIRQRAYETTTTPSGDVIIQDDFTGDGPLDPTQWGVAGFATDSATLYQDQLKVVIPPATDGQITTNGIPVSPRLNNQIVYLPANFDASIDLLGLNYTDASAWQGFKFGTNVLIRRRHTEGLIYLEVITNPDGIPANEVASTNIPSDQTIHLRLNRTSDIMTIYYDLGQGEQQLATLSATEAGGSEMLTLTSHNNSTTSPATFYFDNFYLSYTPGSISGTPTPPITATDNLYFDLRSLFFTIKDSTTSAGTPTQELCGLEPSRQYFIDIQIGVQNTNKATSSDQTLIPLKVLTNTGITRTVNSPYNLITNHSDGVSYNFTNLPFTPAAGENWFQFTLNDPNAITEDQMSDNLYTRAFNSATQCTISGPNFDHNADGQINLLDYNLFLNAWLNSFGL